MKAQGGGLSGRVACFAYGLFAYALFLVAFTYTAGFLGNFAVPKSIDSGAAGPLGMAILVNALLLGLFAVQHTIMARPWFKVRWTKIVPEPIERSTFVLATSLIFFLMFWQWRSMPDAVWSVESSTLKWLLHGLFALGFLIVLYSSFLIDHFDLFGMRQVTLYLRGRPYTDPPFAQPWLYRLVRNPLMLGFLIAFWATPVMTQGHLLFSLLTTAYIFVGIHVEERDLLRRLGDDYRRFRERTPMILPIPRRRAQASGAPPAPPFDAV